MLFAKFSKQESRFCAGKLSKCFLGNRDNFCPYEQALNVLLHIRVKTHNCSGLVKTGVILSCYGHKIKQPIKFVVLIRTTNQIFSWLLISWHKSLTKTALALNNVVLPTLFNVVNNIVQHCYTWLRDNSGSTMLNNIVDNIEQYWQHSIVQGCFHQPWTGVT